MYKMAAPTVVFSWLLNLDFEQTSKTKERKKGRKKEQQLQTNKTTTWNQWNNCCVFIFCLISLVLLRFGSPLKLNVLKLFIKVVCHVERRPILCTRLARLTERWKPVCLRRLVEHRCWVTRFWSLSSLFLRRCLRFLYCAPPRCNLHGRPGVKLLEIHGITCIPVNLMGMKFLGYGMPIRPHHNGTPCCFPEAAVAESDESSKGKNKFRSILYDADIARQNTGTINSRQ